MHLAFIDPVQGYTADRPDQPQAFYGTSAAICFLARAMQAAGLGATLFNNVEQPQEALGIRTLPLTALNTERANPIYDAFVFCGRWTQPLVDLVALGAKAPLVVWMHESTFKPEQHITLHPAFNAISFVSNWQAGVNRGLYPAHWKSAVIRNALNPVYKQLFSEDEDITSAKINPPLAIYTGKAPRGVLNLLALWPYLHSAHPQWQLAVFCNPAEGLGKEEEEKWYNRFRELPGLIHIGEVAPRDHAAAMRRGQVLLMPNPAYETSCIALMEAMASGMRCVITGRAALPETAHEYALVAPMDNANDPIRYDLPIDITAFLNQSHRAMTE